MKVQTNDPISNNDPSGDKAGKVAAEESRTDAQTARSVDGGKLFDTPLPERPSYKPVFGLY